ncbi:MAG: hypothetical protein JWM20_839 [Patescibacteria group bacterium]|nr:hypothetical protein [Patescibacteria group bacterium]
MENELLPVGEAAKILNVSITTLRRWDESGKLRAVRKSPGGDRFYRKIDLEFFPNNLFQTAFEWATADSKEIPHIPRYAYAENSAVFQTKLGKFQEELLKSPLLEDIFSLVVSVSGEIGGNSFDHNLGRWPDEAGIFFAYDTDKREVVLADRGLGILTTLRQALPDLIDDGSAINTAFTEVVSGRTQESRGNGLKFVRTVVTNNLIGLRFQSGNAELEIKHDSSNLDIRPAVRWLRGCVAYIKY